MASVAEFLPDDRNRRSHGFPGRYISTVFLVHLIANFLCLDLQHSADTVYVQRVVQTTLWRLCLASLYSVILRICIYILSFIENL